jgi:hypothetical protein
LLTDVSIAKTKNWFEDYTPFASEVKQSHRKTRLKVFGVDTVPLTVKTSKKGRKTILLRNVLHVPSAVCNVIGLTEDMSDTIWCSSPPAMIRAADGLPILLCTVRFSLLIARLTSLAPKIKTGTRILTSRKHPNNGCKIQYRWSDAEKARWESFHLQISVPNETDMQCPPYTEAEKFWVKQNFGNEYNLLRLFNCSMFNEQDRTDVRELVRAEMAQEMGQDFEEQQMRHIIENMSFNELFSSEEIDFIVEGWHDISNFMSTYGLDLAKPEYHDYAQYLVKALMSPGATLKLPS